MPFTTTSKSLESAYRTAIGASQLGNPLPAGDDGQTQDLAVDQDKEPGWVPRAPAPLDADYLPRSP
jgi:hypothetical protein